MNYNLDQDGDGGRDVIISPIISEMSCWCQKLIGTTRM